MKFENLMYDGKEIKVIVYLDDNFVENNDIREDENDTLDLTNITRDLDDELEVLMWKIILYKIF